MVKIKICGITTLADALACVDAGADMLGFNFFPRSPRYVAPQTAREIVARLPKQVLSVGVFVNHGQPPDVAGLAAFTGLSTVQLHGEETPDYCRQLRNLFVIRALRTSTNFTPETVTRYEADAILLDSFEANSHGGTGQIFDWSLAQRTKPLVTKLFLAGGLGPENIGEAIEIVKPYGVDACSKLESVPGRKDFGLVRQFIHEARATETVLVP